MTKTEEFIRKARLKLSSTKYRFFGLCLYPIRIVPVEAREELEGYVNYETGTNKFENQIHINSKFVDRIRNYKTINMIDILLHELSHIIRKHDARRGSRDNDLWNVACDHVNDLSLKRLKLSEPAKQWNIIKEIEHVDPIQSEEEVYNWLKNTNRVDVGSEGEGDNRVITVYGDQSGYKIIPDLSKEEITSEQKQVVEDYISQIRAIYNIEKEKGSISGELKSIFDELLRVEIPWETILDKAIKSKAVEKANRRSWKRLNKYYNSLNINLPGYVPIGNKDSLSTLIVHIDSSGSINNDDLRKAGYVIVKSSQYFERIILLIADVSIKQEVEFGKRDYNTIMDYFKTEGIKGRGGTSHKFVFEYMDKFYEEHSDCLSLCISITDMCSDIETVIKNVEFVKTVPLILINTSSKQVITNKNITTILCH